jgi:hypothetical protein
MNPFKSLMLLLVIGTAVLLLLVGRKAGPPAEMPRAPTAVPTEAATAATPAVPQQPEVPPSKVEADGEHLQVIVQNEQGQALEGAAVRTLIRVERGSVPLTNFNRNFTTTSQGLADVLWPKQKFEQLELVVSKDDYASRKMVWDLKTGDAIPPTYAVKLKGGVHVGGYVVDPEGNALADATVSLSRFWRGGEERQNKGEESTFLSQKHVTGSDGRWTARNLPSELLHRIFVIGSHTNFIGVQVSMEDKAEIEQALRAGTHRLQLKRGLEVRGRVINDRQEPIAEAQVWAGRKFSRDRQQTKSDEQGRFTFRNVNEGKADFSASAEGYAPLAKTHTVGAATQELLFQLAKGNVIRGLVQDESSQPIEGVRVSLAGTPPEESYDRYEFSTTTDTEGRFAWTSAPNSPMPFYFGKPGYEQKRGVRLKPDEENVVTLHRSRQVQGLVLDAETEQPVTNFSIAIGRKTGAQQLSTGSGGTKEFRSEQGAFAIDLHEENENGIQATASNYADQTQTLPPAENGVVKVVFKLKPSKSLTGIVVTPDGQPVVGANVALVDGVPGGRSVQVIRGQLRISGSQTKLITTDTSGRFEIASPPETGTIVAADGTGYSSATVAEVKASGRLTLQAMGRIEGVFVQGTAAGAGQELMLSSPAIGINFDIGSTQQTTDASGRFAFENVPAGTLSISRLVRTSSKSRAYSHRTEVVVAPGQTTQVILGGTDATLQGRVRFETTAPETEYILNARLSTVTPQIPPNLTPEQRTAFINSPERKEQLKNRKNYTAAIGPDGSLILDSVAPGQYTLNVTAQKLDDVSIVAKPLASGQTIVTVPPGAHPGTPIHVGEVLLKLVK